MVVDAVGTAYVSDGNNIRMVSAGGMVSTLAGSSAGTRGTSDGIGAAASFWVPTGLALSRDGSTLYVADESNHRIRAIV